jgi:hypothetical protein
MAPASRHRKPAKGDLAGGNEEKRDPVQVGYQAVYKCVTSTRNYEKSAQRSAECRFYLLMKLAKKIAAHVAQTTVSNSGTPFID